MASGWGWALLCVLCIQSIGASEFRVGGEKGWGVPSGSESYNLWAGNNRFQINDTLLFKYDEQVDSVLQVSPDKYKTCNTTRPIKSFKGGFKFDRQGAFYFIARNSTNCKKGERLIVVVMSPCHTNLGGNCGLSSTPNTSPTPRSSNSPTPTPTPNTTPSPSPRSSNSTSPSLSPAATTTPTSVPSLSPPPSASSSPSTAPAPLKSASSSTATSLANLVIPLLLLALLKPSL